MTNEAKTKMHYLNNTLKSVKNKIEFKYKTFLAKLEENLKEMTSCIFNCNDIMLWLDKHDSIDNLIEQMKTLSIYIQLPNASCPLPIDQYPPAERSLFNIAFKLTMARMADQKIVLLYNVDRLNALESQYLFLFSKCGINQLFVQTKNDNIYREGNDFIGLVSEVSV